VRNAYLAWRDDALALVNVQLVGCHQERDVRRAVMLPALIAIPR
jgi:hypothetical protein